MPIHDWTKVFAGAFHDFHLEWISKIKHALNGGVLPPNYYAMAEQVTGGREPDVLTLRVPTPPDAAVSAAADAGTEAPPGTAASGNVLALTSSPPRVRYRLRDNVSQYAQRTRSVVVRHRSDHSVVAIVELVSPGNKSNRRDLEAFAAKAWLCLEAGVHLLVIDLFPPTRRDPHGIHPVIWGDEAGAQGFRFSPEKPLTSVGYRASEPPEAFIEPMAVGDPLPEMPLFLTTERYVPLSLEPTYLAAFDLVPSVWQAELRR